MEQTHSTDRRIYANVLLGEGAALGEYTLIGVPPRGHTEGDLSTVIGRNAVIRSHTVIYAGNVIGDDFQTGHGVLIREANEIGSHVSIGTHSIIEHHVKIASGVRIHSNVFIPEYSTLDENAWIGPCVVFTNALYPLSPDAKSNLRGPHICAWAKIGANATLLPGITVGSHALVGAGAVVVRDVPAETVVVGNPARVLKSVRDMDQYRSELEREEAEAAEEGSL